MKTKELSNINSFYLISDVHLSDPKDALTEKFISFLKSIPTNSDLFLLGDIWDILFVNKIYFQKLWKNVFDLFFQMKKNNVRIFFLEGNHDFGFENFPSSFLDDRFTFYGDCYFKIKNKNETILMAHGDNIVCPKKYLTFRRLVKSWWLQKLITPFLLGFICQLIFGFYAKVSRKSSYSKIIDPEFFQKCVHSFLKNFENNFPDYLIIGHIHQERKQYVNSKTLFISGKDWVSLPSFLKFEDGLITRIFL